MNQLSPGPHDSPPNGPDTAAGTDTAAGAPLKKNVAVEGDVAAKNDATKYEAVAGPFTIRDLTVFGSTLLMFVASLLPMFGERYNLWNLGNLFFLMLGIILPLVVVALFVARRLQPGTVVRIGSLSVDQFASVTAAFAFPLFFLTIANSFNGGVLLGLVGSVGLLAATVLGPHLPWLSADFKGRAEKPAHIVAREATVPTRKPAAPKAPKTPKTPAASGTGFNSSNSGIPGSNAERQGSADGYQPPVSHGAGAAGASASRDFGATGASGVAASSSAAAGAAGAAATGATGASPFAPPASYGTTPSPATEASGVVHSADATGVDGSGHANTGQANTVHETTDHSAAGNVSPAPVTDAGAQPASSAQPAGAQPAGGPDKFAAPGAATPAGASAAASSPEKRETLDASATRDVQAAAPAAEPATTEPATTQHATQPATSQHAPQPAAQQPWAATMATPIVSGDTRRVSDSIGATVDPASRPEESDAPQYEAFWFAVGQPRTAYDEHTGTPAFTIEPGGWVLALEDRGHEFLVQDTDGKLGILRELSNIERG